MATRDLDQKVSAPPDILRFDGYVLDLKRGCLLSDGREVVLRPKTFAVLRYFAQNSGRLLSKDDIFAAVWPGLAITDDVLVQSVGELRRALGDDGVHLIKTVPRRGYRFEADVATGYAATASEVPGDGPSKPVEPPLPKSFIASRIGTSSLVAMVVAALAVGAAGLWFFHSPPTAQVQANASNAVSKPALAILPFVNQSGDQTRNYFADGLTQDLISAMGRFSALTVMSWNAVSSYKDKTEKPEQIARDLGVRYQLEGSVRQADDRVRVSAQLVNGGGQVLWSARFDEPLTDLFALQDKIVSGIAGALAIRLTQAEQQRISTKPTDNLEAYDLVLRARPALQRPTRANNAEARAQLRQAITLDPNYAAAYAALGETYYIAVSMGWAQSPVQFLSMAADMANRALTIDDVEVRAHVILGRIHLAHHRYDQAKAEMERAIAINPNDAHALAGLGNIEMWSGEAGKAIDTLELAQRIDPELNAMDRFALGLAYYLKQRYAASIEQAQLNLRKAADAHFTHVLLAAAHAQQGQHDDAALAVKTIHRVDPTFDPEDFGTKFLKADDLDHLRDGMRKAGLKFLTTLR